MKKEIKFEDYIFLGANALPEEMTVSFLDYFKFLLDSDFKPLEEHLTKTLNLKKFPQRHQQQIIEGILPTSLKDLEKKRSNPNFYICNSICLLNVLRSIYTRDLYNSLNTDNVPAIVLHNYEHILRWLLIDSGELENLYNNIINKDFEYQSYFDSRYVQSASIHQVLRQSLFGQVSNHSFADMEISASIATIRQLIELRIRRAFGILSYIDDEQNLLPLDLSMLFQCLNTHIKDITFPFDLKNIERIYKWSNMYIHSGKKDFSWIPYFLNDFLKEFSFGIWKNGSWNINNAISTTQSTIEAIHNELINLSKNGNVKIYGCRPECHIV